MAQKINLRFIIKRLAVQSSINTNTKPNAHTKLAINQKKAQITGLIKKKLKTFKTNNSNTKINQG